MSLFLNCGEAMRQTATGVIGVILAGAAAASLGAQARYEPGRPDVMPGVYTTGVGEAGRWELPVFVSAAEGDVWLTRQGQAIRDIENVPLETGDELRSAAGRVELLFDDGSVMALDRGSTVRFTRPDEVDLPEGRLRVVWRDRGVDFVIQSPAGRAVLRQAGDYRITIARNRVGDAEIEVAVTRGSAELANTQGRTVVREGTRALTTDRFAPSVPYAFSVPRDDFQRWTDELERDRYGVYSSRYLPDELRYYGGVFDRYGDWRYSAPYGYVWYPRVNVGWQPYRSGRWSFVVNFGYSWIGGSRWDWPTHHYGRWDCIGDTWFWVPSRPTTTRPAGYAVPRTSYTQRVDYFRSNGSYRSYGTDRSDERVLPTDRRQPSTTLRREVPVNQPRPSRDTDRDARPQMQERQAPTDRRAPSAEARRDTPREAQRDTPREVPREREAARDNAREKARDTSRPAPSETVKSQPPRGGESSRPSARPEPRESPRTPPQTGRAPESGSRTPSGGARSGGTAVRRGGGR